MDDLNQLHNDISRCRDCAMRNRCSRTVPGVGVAGADVMAVGQAPEKQEDQQGVAFVGPAGQFLAAILDNLGFDWRRVYFTNWVKCFPGRIKGGDAKPPQYAAEACRKWVKAEYDLVRPKVCLAIGDISMKNFGIKGGIKKNHAKVFYTEEWGAVIPVLHPAGLMRRPSDTPAFACGLNILNTHLRGYEVPPPHIDNTDLPVYTIKTTKAEEGE